MNKGKEIINEPFWMHPDNEKENIGNNKMNGIYIKGISMPNGGTLKIEIGYDANGHPMALIENHDVFDVVLADVRPVVRARWIDTDNYYQRWKCSACGCHTRDAAPDFCPNCGAEMEGTE